MIWGEKLPIIRPKPGEISVISSVQLFSRVWLFATPWIAARQTSLSITNSRSSLTHVHRVNDAILCRPLLLLPPILPSIRVFSNESTIHMRWPKYWSFSFSIISSKQHPVLISLQFKGLSMSYTQITLDKNSLRFVCVLLWMETDIILNRLWCVGKNNSYPKAWCKGMKTILPSLNCNYLTNGITKHINTVTAQLQMARFLILLPIFLPKISLIFSWEPTSKIKSLMIFTPLLSSPVPYFKNGKI